MTSAVAGEARDHDEVAVRALDVGARQLVRGERDRRDERDARLDERLRLGEVVQLRDVGDEPRDAAYAVLNGQLPAPW